MYATGDVVANLLPINNLNGPTWRPSPNNTDWDTPEWKDFIQQVATEPDPAKQKTLYAAMNDYILDQSWAMPFATNPQILVRQVQRERRHDQSIRSLVLHRRLPRQVDNTYVLTRRLRVRGEARLGQPIVRLANGAPGSRARLRRTS